MINLNLKKAAMFGLDARIALAIFGSLSVISGASLHSAIKNAEVVALVTKLDNIKKAIDQYALDTGEFLPEEMPNSNVINAGVLRENILSNSSWQGPYLKGSGSSSSNSRFDYDFTKNKTLNSRLTIRRQSDSTWPGPGPGTCMPNDCSMYLGTSYSAGTEDQAELKRIYNLLDERLDDGDGPLAGDIRINNSNALIYFKLGPALRYLENN